MVAAINDKSDGFLDDLLPYAHILLNETDAGCNDLERTRSGLNALQSWDRPLVAAVGPQCSGELVEVARAEARAELAYDTVFISPSSTATKLSNTTAYPHVVRLSSPEAIVMAALAAFVERNNWGRVALLHDDGVWGIDSGAAFKAAFVDGAEGRELLTILNNDGDTGAKVPLTACRESDTAAATEWLDRLERVQARIIVLAVEPMCQRLLFATAYKQDRLRPLVQEGYAWLTNWLSTDILQDPDGRLNMDAIRGAEGLIALREKAVHPTVTSDTSIYDRYMQLWAAFSSSGDLSGVQLERCTTQPSASGTRATPFCDADADATTLSSFAAASADAVLVFARAMHAVIQDGGSLDWRDPAALYKAILALDGTAGVSGNIVLGAEGDRAGSFELLNLRVTGSAERARRELSVRLDTERANFISLGIWDRANGYKESNQPIFHGKATQPPLDFVAPPTCGVDGLREDSFFGHNISDCDGGDSHTVSFYWRAEPPGDGCLLPEDVPLKCSYVPFASTLAIALSVLGLLLPLSALGAVVYVGQALGYWRRGVLAGGKWFSRETKASIEEARPMVSKTIGHSASDEEVARYLKSRVVREGAIHAWGILGRVCAVVGALGLCAVPRIFAGQNTAVACVARPLLRALAPATIAFGVTVCDPRPEDEGSHLQAKREGERQSGCPSAAVRLKWCAAVLQLVALWLLLSLAANLAVWSQDATASGFRPEVYELEATVAVRNERLIVPINATRCPMQALGSVNGIRGAGFNRGATVMSLLLGVCLCAHALRIWAHRFSRLGRGLATLCTLSACILYEYDLWFVEAGDDDFYDTLAATSLAIGEMALATEVLLPAYLRLIARREKGAWLLVDKDSNTCPALQVADGKTHHIFLSHVWASGQDQVQDMHTILQLMFPSLKMWIDVEQIKDLGPDGLKKAVGNCEVLLVFLSKGYLASKFCRLEIAAAMKNKLPFILVRESRSAEQGGVSSFDDLISPQQLESAQEEGDDIKDAIKYIRDKAFDNPPKDPDDDGAYVLWWHRNKPFKSAVLQQVVELVRCNAQALTKGVDSKGVDRVYPLNLTDFGSTTPYFDYWKETRGEALTDFHSRERSKWKTREEWETLRQGAGEPITLYVSESYPQDLREALTGAFKYHLDAFPKLSVTNSLTEHPDAVRVFCLYGEEEGGEVHADFFDKQQLLEDTREYFKQRRDNLRSAASAVAGKLQLTSHNLLSNASAAVACPAVLLYSAAKPFSFFLGRVKEIGLDPDNEKKIDGFGEPIWGMWPQDVMMQRVAAKEALKTVMKELRTRHTHSPRNPNVRKRAKISFERLRATVQPRVRV